MSRFKPPDQPAVPITLDTPPVASKWHVCFLCMGNACRSQMAEGFARVYGSDVMEVHSAGINPLSHVPDATKKVMEEKSIDISAHFPKDIRAFPKDYFDLVINMSGYPVSGFRNVRVWPVRDPYQSNHEIYRQTRDQIEGLVMSLILELRRAAAQPMRPAR